MLPYPGCWSIESGAGGGASASCSPDSAVGAAYATKETLYIVTLIHYPLYCFKEVYYRGMSMSRKWLRQKDN